MFFARDKGEEGLLISATCSLVASVEGKAKGKRGKRSREQSGTGRKRGVRKRPT